MRRHRKQATGPAVSLFPFLAVLICTMGVLIVMLVLAVQSSAVKAQEAKRAHEENVSQERDELLDQLDLEQYRVEQITKLRPEIRQRLENEKLRRSHLDDEIRKLLQDAKQLSRQFSQLDLDANLVSESHDVDAAKIQNLKQQIADRQNDLQELRNKTADRPVMYSIVPTRSSGGTLHRPIYIECVPSGIVLQPSGLKISLTDFTKPILPGNPLDAALLATREYWNKFQAGSSAGEPYPLIVVRPGGATAYAIARRAMTSWDDEFGYELVESTKQLNWGESDSNLKRTLKQAMEIAMQRQQQSVAGGRATWMIGRQGQMLAGGGGQTHVDGGVESGNQFRSGGQWANRATNSAGMSGNDESQKTGTGEQTRQSGGIDTSKQDSLSRFALDNRPGGNGNAKNPLRSMSQNAAHASQSAAENGNMDGDPAALSNNNLSIQPLASQRGTDWALPTRTPGATPYRRPIRIECHDDHYLVHSGDPEKEPVRVPIRHSVDFAIDELVNQVWNQIEGWGMAEIGGFWKPVLRLSASKQNGSGRADELARKLEGSGIEIERLWR